VTQAPDFFAHLPLARAAWTFAQDAHGDQRRASDGAPFISHPREVAALLYATGAGDEAVAAGVLHDTVELTPTSVGEITERFGSAVGELVGAVTEDVDIRSYRQRKAALRDQAIEAGEPAAVLFAADKLSKVREYRTQLTRSTRGGDPPRPRRLSHYTQSLLSLERVIPHHPLVIELRKELAQLTPVPAKPVPRDKQHHG
jgi:(p)ppGpp synthase/HD superfamily hydrolase